MAHPPCPPLPASLPRVIGHRGAAAHAPENTLISFRTAARQGARWVECDVRLTADGVPVLLHDAGLERTTDRAGPLRERNLRDLAEADAGAWFAPGFHGEALPTLAAALEACARLALGVNLELKPEPGQAPALVGAVARALAAAPQVEILISSFAEEAVSEAALQLPVLPRGLLLERNAEDAARRAIALGCASVHVAESDLDASGIRRLRAADRAVLAYTVNDSARARALFDLGVRAVFTDDPARLLAQI